MKHACCILLLLTSSLCFASSQITFGNQGGTLTGSNAGLVMSGSLLTSVTGINGLDIGGLGTVAFKTGSIIGGSIQQGAVFNAGGSFTVTGNGSDGLPSGTIFTGTFSSPVSLILVTLSNGTHSYVINGVMTGTLFNGKTVNAVEVQLTVNVGKGFFNGSTIISGGSTVVTQSSVVPEPSSLTLLGTGLLTFAGITKRRLLTRLVA